MGWKNKKTSYDVNKKCLGIFFGACQRYVGYAKKTTSLSRYLKIVIPIDWLGLLLFTVKLLSE